MSLRRVIAPVRVAGLCSIRAKWRYATEADALASLEDARAMQNERRAKKLERRAYECPWCSGWHLTARSTWP